MNAHTLRTWRVGIAAVASATLLMPLSSGVAAATTIPPRGESVVGADLLPQGHKQAITVRCHVVKHGDGLNVIGYVVGQGFSLQEAKDAANLFVSHFGSGVHKKHCHETPHRIQPGAYTVNMEPL